MIKYINKTSLIFTYLFDIQCECKDITLWMGIRASNIPVGVMVSLLISQHVPQYGGVSPSKENQIITNINKDILEALFL